MRIDTHLSPRSLPANGCRRPTAAAADARTLGAGEAFIVSCDEVLLDLLNSIQRDTDNDHQPRSPEAEGDAQIVGE